MPRRNRYGIFGQRFDSAGIPLSGEFRVNTYTTGNQFAPSLAGAADGSFVVVWQEFNIVGRAYDPSGIPMSPEFRVNTTRVGEQRDPVIASNSQGEFVVAWERYDAYSLVTIANPGPTPGFLR